MKFASALLGILLLSLSLFAAPSVTLDYPAEGSTVQSPVYLHYSYDADGTGPSTVACTAYYSGFAVTETVIVPAGGSTVAAYPKIPGENSIVARCEGTGVYQEIARMFTIDPDSIAEPTISAFYPEDGYGAEAGAPVDFTFVYEKGDRDVEYANCYLGFYNTSATNFANFAGMASVKSGVYSSISTEVPPDAISWMLECYDPTDADIHFPIFSDLRAISVSLPGYVLLEYPEEGQDVTQGNWPAGIFSYSYVSNGGPHTVMCDLYVDAHLMDSRSVDSETSNLVNVDLGGFQQGYHHWQVKCANNRLASESRPFLIPPDFLNAWRVDLNYPTQNAVVNFPSDISFTYRRVKDTAPYSVWCYGALDNEQVTNTYGAITDVPTMMPFPVFSGSALFQVVCEHNALYVYSPQVLIYGNGSDITPPKNDTITPPPGFVGGGNGGGVPGLMGSGGGSFLPRPLARTTALSPPAELAVSNTTQPSAQRTVEIAAAVLTAPLEGTVGEPISFYLKSSAGKPLSATDVFIKVPNSTLSLKTTTDSQGKASFTPQAAGLYSYRAAGYQLAGNPTTLVKEKLAEQRAGLDLGEIGNWILLLIALLLVLVILYSAYKIIAGKPEQPQEPASP